jgi:2-polyprenyl-6-methoxyphenol hydroxylase-like FAD-dependent oxidoreductase
MSIDDCDVLIVGAGPVGLLLALMLRPKGVNVKIVERQRALYPLPRAVAFDHESRRLFGSLGLTEELNPILEDIMGEGGENGTNYVWRDADLKREPSLAYFNR